MNILQVANYILKLNKALRKQQGFFRRHAPAILSSGHAIEVDSPEYKRLLKYWQLVLNVICSPSYKMRDIRFSEEELWRILLLSIFTPLYDDLFDDGVIGTDAIYQLTVDPENYVPITDKDKALRELYLNLLRQIPNETRFIYILKEGYHWEKESLKQFNETVTEEELRTITYKKSYYSVLLCHAVLNHYPSNAEIEMLYPISGLLQLTNDAFDVYKDTRSGMYTVANLRPDYNKLISEFSNECERINQMLHALPYGKKEKERYGLTVHAMNAMGYMALQQLAQVTGGQSDFQTLKSMPRHQLICDMDSIPQKIKWLRTIQRLHKEQDYRINPSEAYLR